MFLNIHIIDVFAHVKHTYGYRCINEDGVCICICVASSGLTRVLAKIERTYGIHVQELKRFQDQENAITCINRDTNNLHLGVSLVSEISTYALILLVVRVSVAVFEKLSCNLATAHPACNIVHTYVCICLCTCLRVHVMVYLCVDKLIYVIRHEVCLNICVYACMHVDTRGIYMDVSTFALYIYIYKYV